MIKKVLCITQDDNGYHVRYSGFIIGSLAVIFGGEIELVTCGCRTENQLEVIGKIFESAAEADFVLFDSWTVVPADSLLVRILVMHEVEIHDIRWLVNQVSNKYIEGVGGDCESVTETETEWED